MANSGFLMVKKRLPTDVAKLGKNKCSLHGDPLGDADIKE